MSTIIRTTVRNFERAQNSTNGNPRYVLSTDHGSFKTQADAGWVYGLSVAHTEGKRVELTINGRGTVSALRITD